MKLPDVDDWLPDLPPPDGDEEPHEEDDEPGEDLTVPGGASGASDEAPDESLDIGECVDDDADTFAADTDESWKPDLGEPDLVGAEDNSARVDDDTPGISDDDFETDIGPDVPAGDQGEEGLDEPDDSLLDPGLPPMDADDEGDFEEEIDRALGTGLAAEPEAAERWAEPSWHELETLPFPLPVRATDRDTLVLVDPTAHEVAVLVTAHDGVVLCRRDGASESRNWWRELGQAGPGSAREGPFVAALSRGGARSVLWLATSEGQLFRGEQYGATWEAAGALPTRCSAATVRPDGALLFLSTTQSDAVLFVSEDGQRWFEQRLPVASTRLRHGRLWIAASGTTLALADSSCVLVSRDGGQSFDEVPACAGAVAGVFAGEGGGALLLALDRGNGGLVLGRIDAGAPLELLARVDAVVPDVDEDRDAEDGPASESASSGPRVVALEWDFQREVACVWLRDRLMIWGPRSLQ